MCQTHTINIAANIARRLFMQESIFDKLVGGVADEAKEIKVGPGLDPNTQMGPISAFRNSSGF